LTIGGSAAGDGHQKRDLVAVREFAAAARVATADDGQDRAEASGDAGLERPELLEEVLDRRPLRQRNAQPAGAGRSGQPGPKSHLNLHRAPSQSLLLSRPYRRE
jgi:hypothetical protein